MAGSEQENVGPEVVPVMPGRRSMVFRGVVLLVLALLLLIRPALVMASLTIVAGVLLVAESLRAFRSGAKVPGGFRNLTWLYAGLTLVLGVLCIINPLAMDFAWVLLIGCWQVMSGIRDLALVFRRATVVPGLLLLNGLLALIIGVVFIVMPLAGLSALLWLLGVLLLCYAIVLLAEAFWSPKAN